MVIGKGMIAKEFKSYETKDDFVIFASGVSDSTHAPTEAFERERKLLTNTIADSKGKKLVYFSTCSIYDHSMSNAAYVKHKKNMETIIQQNQDRYTIFRLSNAVGKTDNTNTVVNYFIRHIIEGTSFNVWKNASRNIIDIDDMYTICNELLQNGDLQNAIVNIANPHNYPVPFIVEKIEKHFGINGKYELVDKGDGPHIDISAAEPLFKKFNINFDGDYFSKILQKYFPV